jgi:hypothetical protein
VYLQTYLNQFKGNLPVGCWAGSNLQAQPEFSYVIWQQGIPSPNPANAYYIGLGLLVPAGIVSDQPVTDVTAGEGRVFYCPVQTNPGSGYNDNGNDWVGTPGAATRISYSQRGEWAYDQGKPYVASVWNPILNNGGYMNTPNYPNPWFPKSKDFKNKALIIDLFVSPGHEHFFQGHKNGLNMLTSNWDVQFVQFDKLQPYFNSMRTAYLANGGNPNATTRAYMYAIWKRLDGM